MVSFIDDFNGYLEQGSTSATPEAYTIELFYGNAQNYKGTLLGMTLQHTSGLLRSILNPKTLQHTPGL